MRKDQSSLTALGIAVLRAVESEKPADERICYDPFARKFVPGWFYAMMKVFIKTGYAEMRGPGVMGFLTARCRYMDDVLVDHLAHSLEQLVLLGAGFDSRAYRFPELIGKVKVFEVDHPATQMDKLAWLKKIFGEVPEFVNYVPVDFISQTLEERLFNCGYDEKLKTLFIWEGVTQYLNQAAVDRTLAFVRSHSAPGSAIVFDTIYSSLLDGSEKHNEVANMRRYRGFSQETLSFGIPRGQVDLFLLERGFRQVKVATHEDLHRLYFQGVNASRKVSSGYAIATAVV